MSEEVYNLPEVTQIFLAELGLQQKLNLFPSYIYLLSILQKIKVTMVFTLNLL